MTTEITIVDEFDPEVTAMLQAFYSRSHKPIKERIAEFGTDNTAIKESLKKFYVGYGHKSIGQCGSTTIYLEGISILAAKAIQDTPLYNGQETSTRFIDFTSQPMVDPLDRPDIQQAWIDFYAKAQKPTIEHVAAERGLDLTDAKDYAAAKARAFDILRAFIPAGATTQLSWYTSFTHAEDRLMQLRQHPLEEIREIAQGIIDELEVRYPYACAGLNDRVHKFRGYFMHGSEALNYFPLTMNSEYVDFLAYMTGNERTPMSSLGDRRIKGVPVPKQLAYTGEINFDFILDYGSFRDIQRHRPLTQMLPILTTELGFNDWYLNALPEPLRYAAIGLIAAQTYEVSRFANDIPETDIQYYIPLGFNVGVSIMCNYPQAVYLAEIRTSKFVHPTLRKVAIKMAKVLEGLGYSNIFVDTSDDEFTIRRGQQTITEIGKKDD